MGTLYETRQYKGVDINIYYDDCCESPREFYDHLTTIWSNSRTYCPDGKTIDDFIKELGLEQFPGSFDNLCKIAEKRGYLAVPVYAYIHSGIALSLSRSGQFASRFDSGTLGVVTIPKKQIYEEYDCKRINKKIREKMIGYISGDIEELSSWYEGLCYCYKVFEGTEDEESCNGYIGDIGLENLMDAAKDHINYILAQRDKFAVEFWNDVDKDIAA